MSLFREVDVVPEVRQEAVQMVTIVSLVSAGVGAAIVPGSLERVGIRGIHYRTLTDAAGTEPVSDLYLVKRADDDSEVVRRAFELALGGFGQGSDRGTA
jgi:DNA-binding transcriptional LysR family regulator